MPNPMSLHTANRPETLLEVRELMDKARRTGVQYFPSPVDWRDEVLYFLLPDRFSDGQENSRPMLTREEIRNLRKVPGRPDINWKDWATSGLRWQGGTIKGIQGQLDYLKGLGITTIWVGPIFKQRVRLDSFHGYGVQDFLEVDPRFGTRADLIDLINAAHSKQLKIILDIIINHSGDNWGYVRPQKPLIEASNEPPFRPFPDFYGNPNSAEIRDWRLAWRNEDQKGFTTQSADIRGLHEGVWPRDLQKQEVYTRAGMGNLGESDVMNPHGEHKRTDFFALKDFALDVSNTLSLLSDCFKYWIAITDCDGFRIDTVKHISLEEARNFCGAIREFADSIGKRDFFLVGEIAGGDNFQDFYLDNLTSVLQRNLNAALDIGSDRIILHDIGKGLKPAKTYFDSFDSKSKGFESHRSFGDRHVSILDDHDHVFGKKLRFSAEIPDNSQVKDYQVVAATAFQLFTLGIPCIYYGTEQAFAGPAQSQLDFLQAEGWIQSDRYLREAMFGPGHPRAAHFQNDLETQLNSKDTSIPGFGAFGTVGKHCFDANSPAYVRIAQLCRIRAQFPVLRIGRQYIRQTRNFNEPFEFPKAGELVAWSRILDYQESVCVVNPNGGDNTLRGADIIVSSELWTAGTEFTVVANTAQAAAIAAGNTYHDSHPVGSKVQVKGLITSNESAFIEIRDILPAEALVLLKEF